MAGCVDKECPCVYCQLDRLKTEVGARRNEIIILERTLANSQIRNNNLNKSLGVALHKSRILRMSKDANSLWNKSQSEHIKRLLLQSEGLTRRNDELVDECGRLQASIREQKGRVKELKTKNDRQAKTIAGQHDAIQRMSIQLLGANLAIDEQTAKIDRDLASELHYYKSELRNTKVRLLRITDKILGTRVKDSATLMLKVYNLLTEILGVPDKVL